jgi:hypothetical protein
MQFRPRPRSFFEIFKNPIVMVLAPCAWEISRHANIVRWRVGFGFGDAGMAFTSCN